MRSTPFRFFPYRAFQKMSSPLLHRFASCEKNSLKGNPTYTLPGTERTLFVMGKTFHPNVNAQQYRESSNEDKEKMLDTSYKFSRRLSFLLFFIELKRGGVSFFTFHVKGDFFSERRAPSGFLSLLSSFFSFLKRFF